MVRRFHPSSRVMLATPLAAAHVRPSRQPQFRRIDAGMDDYISKPVKLHEIETAIRKLFGKADAAIPPVEN